MSRLDVPTQTLERQTLLKYSARRDCIRGMAGRRYAEYVAPARQLLIEIMERDGVDVLGAFGDVSQRAIAGGNEIAVNMLACAALDMLEDGHDENGV
jgi:hypothetical protein